MKKYLIYLVLFMVPVWTFAQETALTKIFDKYASDPDFGSIDINVNATSFSWEKQIENTELQDMVKEINTIRIIHTNNADAKPEKFIGRIWKTLERGDYTELASVNSVKGVNMRIFMLKGEGNIVREFAMAGTKDNHAFLFSISGNMDMQKLLSKDMIKAFGEFFSQATKKHDCDKDSHSE